MDQNNRLTLSSAAELFEIRCRGMMARAYSARQVEPSEHHWKMLLGTAEITVRDLGELSHQLDFEFELASFVRPPIEDPDG